LFVPVNVLLSLLVVHWRPPQQTTPPPTGSADREGTSREPRKPLESVAVLPFDIQCSLGSPTDQVKEDTGRLAANLAVALEKNTSLRVIGPDKAVAAGDVKDPMKLGRALGVSAVLCESVVITIVSLKEQKVRVAASVSLIEVDTGYVVWEKDFALLDTATPGQKDEGSLTLRWPRVQDAVLRELAARWPRQ
jgi:TolB-like protein